MFETWEDPNNLEKYVMHITRTNKDTGNGQEWDRGRSRLVRIAKKHFSLSLLIEQVPSDSSHKNKHSRRIVVNNGNY